MSRQVTVPSITSVKPKNVIHISIRPTSNIRYIDSRTINSQNKKNSEQNSGSTNAKEDKQVQIRSSTIKATHYQKSIYNDLPTPDNFSDTTMRNTWSDKNGCVNESHRNRNTNKTRSCFAKHCCGCSYLHVIVSLLAALLLGIAIAAALVGTLINNKTTTTTTTLIISTNTSPTTETTTITTLIISTNTSPTTETTTTTTLIISTNTSPTTEITTTEGPTTELITIGVTLLTTTTETVYGIWNTTSGGDSTPSTVGTGVGNYYTGQMANNAFDNDTNTKYTSFGTCTLGGASSLVCGQATGLYLTPQRGASLLQTLQFCTGNDYPNRDPLIITLEGSNQSSLLLTHGSSWTLIYNDSTGLQPVTNRYTCGAIQSVPNNSIWYSSYRILVTSKRGVDIATQYSEVKLMGYH